MEPRHLLQWLIERDNLNSSSLARLIKSSGVSEKPTSQPQIHKFLGGVAVEPKRATLQPVADYFKIPIDALYDGAMAERVLNDLKLTASSGKAAEAPQNSAPNQALAHVEQAQTATKDIASLEGVLAALSGHLEQLDAGKRTAAATLLTVLSQSPGDQAIIAALVALLQPAAFTQQNRQAA